MSLQVDNEPKGIYKFFTDLDSFILTVPHYQRTYNWEIEQCDKLIEDIKDFFESNEARGENSNGDKNYFLGSVILFKNKDELEIIDGQQRLISLSILFRVIQQILDDNNNFNNKEKFNEIIMKLKTIFYKNDDYGIANTNELKLKISSSLYKSIIKEQSFEDIIKNGVPKEQIVSIDSIRTKNNNNKAKKAYNAKSNFYKNYCFFYNKLLNDIIQENQPEKVELFYKFISKLLFNISLLKFTCNNLDEALRVFNTVNNRGLPLNDSDILKSKLYTCFNETNEENYFTTAWEEVSNTCGSIPLFKESKTSPMLLVFYMLMYYYRAKESKDSNSATTEGLRSFYESDAMKKYFNNLNKTKEIISNMKKITFFWDKFYNYNQDDEDNSIFSLNSMKNIYIISKYSNFMPIYCISVFAINFLDEIKEDNNYVVEYKFSDENKQNLEILSNLLIRILYIQNIKEQGGPSALRTPIYKIMNYIVKDHNRLINKIEEEINNYLNDLNKRDNIKSLFENKFSENMTKQFRNFVLSWQLFNFNYKNSSQDDTSKYDYNLEEVHNIINSNYPLDNIEHIFAKGRLEMDEYKDIEMYINKLGNLAMLESAINMPVGKIPFTDKCKFYKGEWSKKILTKNKELIQLAEKGYNDFLSEQIIERDTEIKENIKKYIGIKFKEDDTNE